MATTEEFLIQLGLDQASVQKVIQQIQQLKQQADTTINIDLQTNATQVAGEVGEAAKKAALDSEQAFALWEDGIRDVQQGLSDLKTTFIALSGAAALISGVGIAQAAEESTNLARANVILQQSSEELAKTQEDLRRVAEETGLTYAQVSAVLFDVASAGFTGQRALEATAAAARAAVPAGVSTADAFNAIATAMNNFGISAEDASDRLVRISDLVRGNLAQVANAIGLIAPTASSAGVSLDEIGAAFATITNKGEDATVAATLLFNAIIAIINPSEEAKKSLQEAGVVFGAAAFQSEDFASKLQKLKTAADEGRISLATIFEQRALRGITPLITDLDQFNRNMEAVGESSGRTQKGLEDFFQSVGPQLTLLKTSALNLATAIGADLLNALQPVITAMATFLTENRELLSFLTKLLVGLGSLTAAWLAYRAVMFQVSAASKVLNGLIRATGAVLSFEGASLKANVAAWYTKLTAETAVAQSPVLRAIRAVIGFLSEETGVVAANAAAWLKNMAARSVEALRAFWIAVAQIIRTLTQETVAVLAAAKAHGVRAFAVAAGSKATLALTRILKINVATMSVAGTAAAALGAAIVGWELGKAINDWVDFEDAVKKAARGSASGIDKVKVALLGMIPIVGQVIAYNTAAGAAAKRQSQTMTEQQKQTLLASEAMEAYNRLLAAGIEHGRAYAAALGNTAAELEALQILEERGKATIADIARRVQLQTEEAARIRAINDAKQDSIALDQVLAKSAVTIQRTQEEWEKIVKRVRDEYAKLQVGGLAPLIAEGERFNAEFNVTVERLKAYAATVSVQKQALSEIMSREVFDKAAFDNANKGLQEAQTQLQATYTNLGQNLAATRNTIIQTGNQYVVELRQQAEQEASIFEEAARREIAAEQQKLAELTRLMDEFISQRDRAVAALDSFISRIEQAQLRRRDPALAEAVQLEKDFNKALEDGIPSAEQQARALQLLGEELARLAGPTQEETRLLEQLAKVQADLQTVESGSAEENRLLEEQKRLQEAVGAEQAKRAEREKLVGEELERANKAADEARALYEQREKSILDLETQRQSILQNIQTIEDGIKIKQEEINQALDEQVKKAQKFVDLQLQMLANAKNLADQASAALLTDATTQTPEQQEAVSQASTQFKESFQAAQEAATSGQVEQGNLEGDIDAIRQQSESVLKWLEDLRTQLTPVAEELASNGEALVPAAQAVQDAYQGLEQAFQPSQDAIQDMLTATQRFAPQIESFSETVASGMQKQSQRLDQTTDRLADVESRVAQLSQTGGGSNGLQR